MQSESITIICSIWDGADRLCENDKRNAVSVAISHIESGEWKASEKIDGKWIANEHVKKAILLYFKYFQICEIQSPPFTWNDKVAIRTDIKNARTVPGAIIRTGAHIGKNAVIMPAFINIGAYVGDNTMIDSYVTVGSCAHIGENCHIGAGSSIGGVLEPTQATPVIIEDGCFIGAGCNILESVVIERGSIIAPGVTVSASTKIVDRKTGAISYGVIPHESLVVPGNISCGDGISMYCALIIKKIDNNTRAKVSISDILRE